MRSRQLPEAIQWYEGMLLGPQHFQQLALRQEGLQHYHSRTISPFHWGVERLEIDPDMLVEGKFRVLDIEALMPDGLLVSSRGVEQDALTLDVAEAVGDPTTGPWTVHLAVPAGSRGSSYLDGELARYSSVEGAPVADQNTGDGELPIPRLRPRVNLFVGETPADKYTSFPLAEVAYKDEAFGLTAYIAPRLRVPASSALGELCSGLAAALRVKAVALSEKVRAPSASQRAPQLVGRKARLASMVAALPPFEAVLFSGVCHPLTLYLQLCSLAGQIAALSASSVPPAFAAYDHNNLHATFRQVSDYVDRVLGEAFVDSHADYLFALEAGVFSLDYDPSWSGRSLVLGVRARSGESEREVAAWMESAIIGSDSEVPSIRNRRVLGAARRISEGEGELVPTRGVQLYSLGIDPLAVLAGEPLRILNPDDPEGRQAPAEIVLYVRMPAKRALSGKTTP